MSDPFDFAPAVIDTVMAPLEPKLLLSLFVAGHPRPKGSLDVKAYKNGRPVLQENNPRSKAWRQRVASEVQPIVQEDTRFPYDGPVRVRLLFVFDRSDVSAETADGYPQRRYVGDIDKLTRNVLDALDDANVYSDDSRVVSIQADKVWTDSEYLFPGVWITVERTDSEGGEP